MKPFFSIQNRQRAANRRFPVVDCNFRPLGFGDFNAHCAQLPPPSFSTMSRDYFAGEARFDFVIESVLFGLVFLAAVPAIFDCARALFEFIRAIGAA